MNKKAGHIPRRSFTIIACCLMTCVLGSIHAFSVFIPEWEALPGANRANVSLIYSTALVSLTAAVLFGHLLFKRLKPPTLFVISGILAGTGMALSATSDSLILLYAFYGILFGAANGIGYGYALQLSGQATPKSKGLSMGLVTAFYAVGATLSPILFVYLIKHSGNALALYSAALIICIVAIVCAILLTYSNASYHSDGPSTKAKPLPQALRKTRALLWVSYGGAVAAGLMVISQAFGIALWLDPNNPSAGLATVIVALGNMLGGFSAGYFADRLSSRQLLRALPVLSCAGLVLLISPLNSWTAVLLGGLGIVGYCYGAIIAVYPVAISDLFTATASPRIYGQIFTAWGVAGLAGPWLSGWLFDQTGSYTSALLIAISFSVVSAFTIAFGIPTQINGRNS